VKIVILDDSITIQMVVEALLLDSGAKDEEIHSFSSGFLALEFISKCGADLIFTDINMPIMGGYEFLEKIHNHELFKHIELFVMSAQDDHNYITKIKKLGVTKLMRKPINAKYFKHHIEPIIARLRRWE